MAADKRSLYLLAPTQTPPPRVRKTLAQGRLESPATRTSSQSPRELNAYSQLLYDPSAHVPQRPLPSNTLAGKHSLGPHHDGSSPGFSHSKRMTKDVYQSPRRDPPTQYTVPGSPHPVISPPAAVPSASLSLSDNEEDSHLGQSPVLVTDASNRRKSPDRTDVPVVTSIITSPVKVICHSPRREQNGMVTSSDGMVTGHTDSARKVQVSSVQRINVDSKPRANMDVDGSLSEDSLDDRNVPTIAGSPVDPRSTAIRVALDEDDKENAAAGLPYDPSQYKSFMGDAEDNVRSQGPLSAGLNSSNVRQQLFDFSVASVDTSLAVGNTSQTNAPDEGKTEKKKKKSKPRIVPSRYMSSASSKKTASKIAEKKSSSLHTKSRVSFASTTRGHSSHDASQLDTTAPLQHNKIVTSTPAVGSIGVLPGHPGGDTAAPTPILPPHSMYSTGGLGYHPDAQSMSKHIVGISSKMKSEALRAEKAKKGQKMKAQPVVPQTMHTEPASKATEASHGEVTQRQLELEYDRLVQWMFLESKLKHTFAIQEKDAQAQLYSMWQENEKLRRHLTELQMEQEKKNKMEQLDRQLQAQLSGLEAIGGNIPKLILEHAQLSEALDTTRHYMPVNGVLLPDNHDELLVALDTSERLLGEIEALTRRQTSKLSNFSKEMTALAKVAQSEVQEHSRCQELLAATATLATQERSLQAHAIQDR